MMGQAIDMLDYDGRQLSVKIVPPREQLKNGVREGFKPAWEPKGKQKVDDEEEDAAGDEDEEREKVTHMKTVKRTKVVAF